MLRIAVTVAVTVFAAAFARAAESDAQAPSAAPSRDSQATSAQFAAGEADGLTSEDILRKCSQAYKKAGTYYEEARLNMSVAPAGEGEEERITAVTAYRRAGDVVKIDLTGDLNAVLYFSGGDIVYYNRAANEYARKTGQDFGVFVADMEDLALALTPAGDDLYASVIARAALVSAPKAAVFEGKKVYEIYVAKPGGENHCLYFDRTTLYLVGVRTIFAVSDAGGDGAITYTKTVDRILVDELPKGADGKEADVFSFVIPAGAKEIAQPGEGAANAGDPLNPSGTTSSPDSKP